MSWYSTGYDAVGKEEARLATLSGPRRFWMPGGSSRSLVLVDDVPFNIYEHNAKINGRWDNQHTCMKGIEDPCESCARLGERSRYLIGYQTMVDCSKHVDKKGNTYQYEVKLIGGKLGSLKKWRRKKEEKGSLIASRWKVHREDDKKPSIGDDWDFQAYVDDHAKLFALANYKGKKLEELWVKAESDPASLKVLHLIFQLEFDPEADGKKLLRRVPPFNYAEILKPRGNSYLKDLLGGASRDELTGNEDDSSSSSSDMDEEDVPF